MKNNSSAIQQNFVNICWTQTQSTKWFRIVVLIIGGSLLLTLSAKIQVPFWPVPITMQTMVALLLGMGIGWRLGGAAYILYVAEGAFGFPVFAGTPEKGIGLSYIMGPTGGYLFGMFIACVVAGKLAEFGWDRNIWTAILALLIGNILIYVPGLLWLGSLLGWEKPILEWGFYPFLYGDIAKILLGATLMRLAWKLLKKVQQ